MSCYKLYTTGTADADAGASLEFRDSGEIDCVYFDGDIQSVSDNVQVQWELSFAATRQLTTNDTQNVIATVTCSSNFTTSGQAMLSKSVCITTPHVRVGQGERIFLHREVYNTAPVSSRMTCFIYVRDKLARTSPSRRR